MDAISSYFPAKLRVDNRGVASKFGGTTVLPRKELSFSRLPKVFSFQVLHSTRKKLVKPLCPSASSSSSPNAEPGKETAENGIKETHPSKTVRVRFLSKKKCENGELLLIVGGDPMFGSWNPSSAIPMNWSVGNVWTLEQDIPVGRRIPFKLILRGTDKRIQWQPDPDRVLITWETDKTIIVYEDWEDAASQRITEGEILSDPSKAGMETAGNGTEDPSKTVRVRFLLKKRCEFLEHFFVVGGDPIFGSWDPKSLQPMQWSAGNVWSLDMDIPVRRRIPYKFVHMDTNVEYHWQPDPDRVLQTWETDKIIIVYGDWEDAASHRIIEGETVTDPSKKLADRPEMHIVGDKWPLMARAKTENGSVLADTVAAPAEIPPEKTRDEFPSGMEGAPS
ncbi:uncharacterized protein LOC116207298 isoform X2 [Punica granatum]|uniref:Uncharacterized protein LOC116207298 isoform X2 n=2 Tax=Punica granatum TaxID=22663 RepID=A0A6P8DHT3_PUNGR|nr:uncharacterized protein LOC116207298 isoform X2 [Punica granatum]